MGIHSKITRADNAASLSNVAVRLGAYAAAGLLAGHDGEDLRQLLIDEAVEVAQREAARGPAAYAKAYVELMQASRNYNWVSFERDNAVRLHWGIVPDEDDYPALRRALDAQMQTVDGARAAIMDVLVGQGHVTGPSFVPNEGAARRAAEMAH